MMHVMLCRNRVKEFDAWKQVFDSHAEAHHDAGLRLMHLWQAVDDPDSVFFLFQVDDLDKARRFIRDPDAEEAAHIAGVVDGEYHFLRTSTGY